MVFDWDPNKAISNLKKHGIDFYEAMTVLGDTLSSTYPDTDHLSTETRFVTVGMSSQNRVLVIAHTERGGVVRIISCSTSHAPREEVL